MVIYIGIPTIFVFSPTGYFIGEFPKPTDKFTLLFFIYIVNLGTQKGDSLMSDTHASITLFS